jgi:hypothetical protein
MLERNNMKAQSLRDETFVVEIAEEKRAYQQGYELACGGDHMNPLSFHIPLAEYDNCVDAMNEFIRGRKDAMIDAERYD